MAGDRFRDTDDGSGPDGLTTAPVEEDERVNDDRIVTVIGATGHQGGAVVRHLLSDGWRVRALTRRPEQQAARELAELGAGVVRADMADQRSLVEAFRDAYGVYSVQNPMISGSEGEIVQGKNVADAAKEAGVQHVVYGSTGVGVPGSGVGWWESKLAVQAHMEQLRLPLTVLRPTAFMELMTDRSFFPAVSTWHLMPKLIGADRPIPWICVDDLGAIAARAFAEPDRFVGADVKLAAETRSIAECREIWRDVNGRSPRGFPMPVWMFERFVSTDLTTMWRWLRTGDVDADLAETHAILPTVSTVRQWLIRQASRRSRLGKGEPDRRRDDA
jgi:uncharacterized protein YbjT (DUF2867 family)